MYQKLARIKKPDDKRNKSKNNPQKQLQKTQDNLFELSLDTDLQPEGSYANGEEKMLSELKKLEEERNALIKEKRQLENTENTLRQTVREEIKVRKQQIEKLKIEISNLKQRCEALAKLLDIPIQK